MIEVSHLTKKYGPLTAVDDISFSIKKGEVVGFLGPNGAGKTTTMNILTGYVSSTAGKAVIDGFDILEEPMEAKKRIGYLPEQPPLYPDMTVTEYLRFVCELKKIPGNIDGEIEKVCRMVRVEDVSRRLIKNLSKGYRQRVGLAQALVGSPPVLILDEPTVGLDPAQIVEIRSLIKKLGETHTVILSTHILSEVQAICSRVLVINGGRIVADGSDERISDKLSGGGELVCLIAAQPGAVLRLFSDIPGIKKTECTGEKEKGVHEFVIRTAEGKDVRREIFERLSRKGWPLLGMKRNSMSLEDMFMALTTEN